MLQFGQEANKYVLGNVLFHISTGNAAATSDQVVDLGELTVVNADMNETTTNDPIRYVKINKSTDGSTITNNVSLTLQHPSRMAQQFLTIQTDAWAATKDLTVVDPTGYLTLTDVVDGTSHAFLLFYSDGLVWHLVSTNDVDTSQ